MKIIRMKRLIFFTSLVILIGSCKEQVDHFTVSGEIKNANGIKLFLEELQTNNIVVVDSVILNNEGNFSFEGQSEIVKFYALRTSPTNYLTLIINPLDQIIINADGRDLARNPEIINSEESKAILQLRTHLELSVQKIDSLGLYYKSVIGTKEQFEIRDSLANVSRNIIDNHIEFTKDFIVENINSLASLMALYQQIAPRRYVLNPNEHLWYFNLVDSSLMSLYPQSEAVKNFHAQVEDIKAKTHTATINHTDLDIGSVAPDIVLPNPDGDTISLSSFKGKYVLIDFWASWCRPCRVENPNLVRCNEKYNAKGFEIFQISLDKKREAWIEAIEKDQLHWTHVSDLQYWNSVPVKIYNVQGIPANFLIDRQGKIIAKNLRGDILEAKLSEIFD